MWLDEDLKKQVRQVFEPRYNRPITELEVIEIAGNLTNFMEDILRFRWRTKNEKITR